MPRHVLQEQHRQEDGNSGGGGGQQCALNLTGTFQGCLAGNLSLLTQANDVFRNDDGRVQHHADGKCQSGQGNNIKRSSGQLQHDKCRQQRDRNGDGNQQRGAAIAQEPPEDAYRQHYTQNKIARYEFDRTLDKHRSVERLLDIEAKFF